MQRRHLLRLLAATGVAQAVDASVLSASSMTNDASGPAAVPVFHFNQVGFLTDGPKVATVVHRGRAPEVRLRSVVDHAVVWTGMLSAEMADAASGDRTSPVDFSAFNRSGRFRLEHGGAESTQFVIAADVHRTTLRAAMRAFYGQRCGCAVDLGGGYRHAACHLAGSYHASSGKTGAVSNPGGWHDAGDYGRYVVNSGITCGTLLWAWEMFPSSLRGLQLDLADDGVKCPDFLAEVLWNLRWMMSLQDEDGGVFHKQTSVRFCAFIMPEQDDMPSEIIGTGQAPFKSTGATADFAAVMAIAARCYRAWDAALAERFLAAAKRAFDWAQAHPDVCFRNPPGVTTGEYGDRDVSDEILWAAAELWRTTGEARYDAAFRAGAWSEESGLKLAIDAPGWPSVGSMACWTYGMTPHGNERLQSAIREVTEAKAQQYIRRSAASGYGNTLAEQDYVWGSNGVAANQSLLLALAHRFSPEAAKVRTALGNLDYLLGRNCHGVSWVTQVGTRPFLHPHHRPSAADGIALPWPGLLSGGPNRHPGDEVARTVPQAPPMRMWIDHKAAYSMNEVAINWNAPLVFLLAFANEQQRHPHSFPQETQG